MQKLGLISKRGGSRLHTYIQNFFGSTKSQNLPFFVQKKLLHCYLLLCIEKYKPALSYKWKP